MSVDLVFDLETLAVKPRSAVILSLAIIPFTLDKVEDYADIVKRGFYRKCDAIAQLKAGGMKEDDTVAWWREQSEEAQRNAFLPSNDDILVQQAFLEAIDWIKQTDYSFKDSHIWSRGVAFDFPKIEYRFDQVKEGDDPVNYWRVRDIRTFVDCLTGSSNGIFKQPEPQGFIKHHALHDCARDVLMMQTIAAMLRGEPQT